VSQAVAPASPAGRRGPSRTHLQLLGVYIALLIICVALTIASPYFLTARNVTNILVQASTFSLIGAGLTIVLIAGEIDLAFAAIQALVGSCVAVLVIELGVWWPIGVVLGLLIGTFAGFVSGAVAVFGRLPTFITTLAMLGIAQGVGLLLTDGQPVAGFPEAYEWFGRGKIGPIPVPIIIVVITYFVLHLMLTRTKFGLDIYATGGSKPAAILSGISWGRVVIGVLALSGLLSAMSGIIITSRLNAGSGTYGTEALLPVVAGVIIGGTSLTGGVGSLIGTFGGILITVTISNGLVLLNVSQFWQQIVVGLIILAAVMIDQIAKGALSSGARRRRGSGP
jgi:ribose/xylose/arabinose/galactoside ABC-type transport system permease subunit